MVECHVYDTLDQHKLDFEALSRISITKIFRILYCSCCQQLDGSSCSPLVIAIARDLPYGLNPQIAKCNVNAICEHLMDCFTQ